MKSIKLLLVFVYFLPIFLVVGLLAHHIYLQKKSLNPQTIINLNNCHAPIENRVFTTSKNPQSIAVLVYHRIVKRSNFAEGMHISKQGKMNPTVVPYQSFEAQMEYLYQNHFTTLTLNEFYAWLENGKVVPEKSVLLTFDDGFKNNYTNVYPILEKYDFRATVFVITSKIQEVNQKYNPHSGQYLSRQDIQASCDKIDYQSHTYNNHHINPYEISSFITNSTVKTREDLKVSIHNLDGNHLAFAYPYGQYDEADLRLVKQLFQMAFITPESPKREGKVTHNTDPYKIPRYTIFPATTMNEFIEFVE